jgi:hypothetical protein
MDPVYLAFLLPLALASFLVARWCVSSNHACVPASGAAPRVRWVAHVSHVSLRARLRGPSALELKGRHVLITGGSSGIGEACAVLCVLQGAKVTLVARRGAELLAAKTRVAAAATHAGACVRMGVQLCGAAVGVSWLPRSIGGFASTFTHSRRGGTNTRLMNGGVRRWKLDVPCRAAWRMDYRRGITTRTKACSAIRRGCLVTPVSCH